MSGSAAMRACTSISGSSFPASPAMARRSAPEQKLPPAPVRRMQRTSGSRDASTNASYIRISIAPESAFIRCGRFRVTVRRWSCRSTIASGIRRRYAADVRRRKRPALPGSVLRGHSAPPLPFAQTRASSVATELPADGEAEFLPARKPTARLTFEQRSAQVRLESGRLVSEEAPRRDGRGEHEADDRVARPDPVEDPLALLDLETRRAQLVDRAAAGTFVRVAQRLPRPPVHDVHDRSLPLLAPPPHGVGAERRHRAARSQPSRHQLDHALRIQSVERFTDGDELDGAWRQRE